MGSLFNYAIAFVGTIGVIVGVAKHDFWKRKNEYMDTVQQKNKYKRTTRKIDIVLATSIILLFALYYFQPDDIQDPVAKIVEEPVAAGDVDSESGKVIELGPYSVASIPNGVPSAYQMQYEELTDIISRANATLTLIKGMISSCETPCAKPLSEIESKFDAMNDVIEETRNELFRGSEIVRVMAEEDPEELHTQKLYELQQELLSTRSSLETMLIADSWESWEEPIEYAENTRKKRLFKILLGDTVLPKDYHVEGSTLENGEPIVNEESPEALQSAEFVILGFMELTEEIRSIVDSVYISMDADHIAADYALTIVDSTREQAVIASNSFADAKAAKELSGAIARLDSLKEKLLEYNDMQESPGWNLDRYDEVLMHVDTFYEDMDFNPVTVKQFLEVYGY